MSARKGSATARDCERIAARITAALDHRGPDSNGVTGGTSGAVGMARLRVRSDPGAAVPFVLGEHRSAAYNGEVYVSAGDGTVPSGGRGEVECILAAAADETAPDGMYALATYDTEGGALELYRDRFGIKPLYVRTVPDGLAFASEIPALLTGFAPATLRRSALEQFLGFGKPLDGGTLYDEIVVVPPGSRTLIADGSITARRLPPAADAGRERAASADDVREAIRGSLRRTVVADRKLGIATSGGLDSTILAFELADMGFADIDSVSVVAHGSGDGLVSLAPLKCTAMDGWRHHSVPVSPDGVFDGIGACVRASGHPSKLSSYPLYMQVARAARSAGVVVLLTGEGADELYAGYGSYAGLAGATEPAALDEFYLPAARRRFLDALFGPGCAGRLLDALHDRYADTYDSQASILAKARRIELDLSLDPLLERTDVALMAYGVEGRVPFLHGDVPGIGWDAADEALFAGDRTKALLRDTYAPVIGDLAGEPKRPFRAPLRSWMSGSLADRVHAAFRADRALLTGVGLRPQGLDLVYDAMVAGDAEACSLAYGLLSVGAWLAWLARERLVEPCSV